ncbi:polysaccharide deacetylase family protein [Larkinella sp. VNQ87]|uniref:polysaccharide deacetylase family protein n=1 Tax=Larkinella sp. VNQ87 TaxID=3400921 RepID=UPI003C08E391
MCKIIYYHGLYSSFPELSFSDPAFTRQDFARQVELLSRRYELITLNEALERSNEKNGLKQTLCVTTDDGLADNLVFAEILDRCNGKLTLFLNNNFIDNQDMMWRNKIRYVEHHTDSYRQNRLIGQLAETYQLWVPKSSLSLLNWSRTWPMALKDHLADRLWEEAGLGTVREFLERRKLYLNWTEIKELTRQGHAIGGHTRSHPDCSLLSWEELKAETVDAVGELRQRSGEPVHFLAYPFGIRPRSAWDRRLRAENSGLKRTMGIAPSLQSPTLEEREDMEKSFWKSMVYLYLMPVKRALF